jgi:ADP-ribose pyrophosphatase YjhB (NUDIX family)
VLALDRQGRVLLIRHSYGSDRWMPPGGGMKRGEDARIAGARELLEETGCRLHGAVLVTCAEETMRGAHNTVHIIAGQTADTPRPDGREVLEAQFFALDALPDDLAPQFRERLGEWITAAKAARHQDAGEPPHPQAPTG